ncbi:hypothetical protein AB834_03480 [PVC group bacterium (ex Bugula neritina AB1)]|nr:hypothetical protein AB834_03480 [PVC group bacterium (ex Bugula neritina AB1)]
MPFDLELASSRGIVLKRFSWQENGVLAVVFSEGFGKIILSDPLMKKKERLGGKTDLFSLIEFTFIKNDRTEYQRLVMAESLDKFMWVYRDPLSLALASLLTEVVDKVYPVFSKQAEVFELLKFFFSFSENKLSIDEIFFRMIFFLVRLTLFLGGGFLDVNENIKQSDVDTSEGSFNPNILERWFSGESDIKKILKGLVKNIENHWDINLQSKKVLYQLM